MQMKQLLLEHIDEAIKGDEEAIKFIGGFVRNIPGGVLDLEIDASAGKHASEHGGNVYCYGIYPANTAFIEYYESRESTAPSMALYADRAKRTVTVKGSKEERRFYLCYEADEDGEVHKTVNFE